MLKLLNNYSTLNENFQSTYHNEFSEYITKIYKLYGKHKMWFSTLPVYRKPFVNKIYSYIRI